MMDTDGISVTALAHTMIRAEDGAPAGELSEDVKLTNVGAHTVDGMGNRLPVLQGDEELTFQESGAGAVGSFRVTDMDADSTFSWTLAGPDAAAFRIEPDNTIGVSSATLRFRRPPDFEMPLDVADPPKDNNYVLTVTVTDNDGGVASQSVRVRVTDRNDAGDDVGMVRLSHAGSSPRVGAAINAELVELDMLVGEVTWQWEVNDCDMEGWTVGTGSGVSAQTYFPAEAEHERCVRAVANYMDEHDLEDDLNIVDSGPSQPVQHGFSFGVQQTSEMVTIGEPDSG